MLFYAHILCFYLSQQWYLTLQDLHQTRFFNIVQRFKNSMW